MPYRADGVLVNLIVTNFSGGKRHSGRAGVSRDTASSGTQLDPLDGIAQLTDTVRPEGSFVLAIQEMTTDDPGLPTRALGLEKALGSAVKSTFVPRVSTSWYPLREKWGEKIDSGGAQNEGLCAVSSGSGLVLTPWSSLPIGSEPVDSSTRVLDLPNFGFPETETDVSKFGWLHAQVTCDDGRKQTVRFRPTFYRGNRNSDPRVAQACLLAWREAGQDARSEPACVLINVHLSTLKTEYEEGVRERRRRPEATFLRTAQLDVIARYVDEVRRAGMPVIIAGDFNAEPSSPEMTAFSLEIGSEPLLKADICWKCGTVQKGRHETTFYVDGLVHTRKQVPGATPVRTRAVCSNESCLEPRYTHKGHMQLLDNVFVLPAVRQGGWEIAPGRPHVDLSLGYSDHAAIVLPLSVARPNAKREEDEV